MNYIKIDFKTQLEIFEKIFLYFLEYPSLRWQLKKMVESQDRIDEADLDLKLRKLELEIIERRNNEKNQR